MSFGIAPKARTPFKAPAVGYTRRDPDNIGIAIKFSPPPSVFSGAYKYDPEWTLKNFAKRRIFAPPGGHGGASGGVPTIGFSENFGSTGFWENNGFYLTMDGSAFFHYEDGRPRNRNVIEATYTDSAYADRFIAYGFRYAKRIANDSSTGNSLIRQVARSLAFAALMDRRELLTAEWNNVPMLPDTVSRIINDYGFIPALDAAYTYRSAAELISALRVFLFDYFNSNYKKDYPDYVYSAYDVTQINDALPDGRKVPAGPLKLSFARESILKAMSRLRSGKFLDAKGISELVDHTRSEARQLISGFSGEREWAAFEPKRTFERRIKGEQLTTAEGAEGGGIIVAIPPLSLLVWNDSGDSRKRELFDKYVSQWTFAGLFVARTKTASRSELKDLWQALRDNNFARAEVNCDVLYAPNPFWTAQLSGMKTVEVPNLPNFGYGGTADALAALLRKRYRDWDDLRSNETFPGGDALELQTWVRENVVTPDQYADPQYTGLQALIAESWKATRSPLMAGDLYYSDYARLLIGKPANGGSVTVSMPTQPPGVPILRSSDAEFVRSTMPSDLRARAGSDDLPSILKAQEWFSVHYDPASDVAPVYLDPTNLVQTALIKISWVEQFMALKMTEPKLKNARVYDNGAYVWKLMYAGQSIYGGDVYLDPNNVPEDVVKAIHPVPPTMDEIKRGLLAVDTMDVAFGGREPFEAYVWNRFGRRKFGPANADIIIYLYENIEAVYRVAEYSDMTPRMVESIAAQKGIPPLPEDPQDHPIGDRMRVVEYIQARAITSLNSTGIQNVLDRAREMSGIDLDGNLTPRSIDEAMNTLTYGTQPVFALGERFVNARSRPYNIVGQATADVFVKKLIPNFSDYKLTGRSFANEVAAYNDSYSYSDATIEQMLAFVRKFPPGVEVPYFRSRGDYEEFLTRQVGDLTVPSDLSDATEKIRSIDVSEGGWRWATKESLVAIARSLGLSVRDDWADGAPLAPFFTREEAKAFGENRFGKKQGYKILIKIADKIGKGGVADLTRAEVEEYGPEFYEQPKPMHPLVPVWPGYHQSDPTGALMVYLGSDGDSSGLADKYELPSPTMRLIVKTVLNKSPMDITFEDISDFVYDYPPGSPQFESLKTDEEYKNRELFVHLVDRYGGNESEAYDYQSTAMKHYAKRFLGEGGSVEEMTIGQVRDAAKDFVKGGFDMADLPFMNPTKTKEYVELRTGSGTFTQVAAIVTKKTGKGYTGDFTPNEVDAAIEVFRAQPQAQAQTIATKYVPAVPQPDTLLGGEFVVRGPKWGWGDQDGGPGNVGTVLYQTDMANWFRVTWPNGYTDSYRYNPWGGMFDLTVVVPQGTGQKKWSPVTVEDVIAMAEGLDKPIGSIDAINEFLKAEIAKRGLEPLKASYRIKVRAKATTMTGKEIEALTKSDILQALDALGYTAGTAEQIDLFQKALGPAVSELDQPFGTEAKAVKYVKSVLGDYQIEKTLDNIEILIVRAYQNTGKSDKEALSKNDVNTALDQLRQEKIFESVVPGSGFSGIDSRPVWPRWA